jgi:predicted DNA-binding transcriptional regulator AlpA
MERVSTLRAWSFKAVRRENMILTPKEAAVKLGLAEATLAKWRWDGSGPPYAKLGSRVLYREEDLENWVLASIRQSTSGRSER